MGAISIEDRHPTALRGLVSRGALGDVNIRPVLLRVVTDMFTAKENHTADGVRQFEEIASQMLRDADDDLRRFVAKTLASHRQAPMSILEWLAAGGGAAAAIVFEQTPNLERGLVAAAARAGETPIAVAIAGRTDLDRQLVAILAERPESDVIRALAANRLAPIDPRIFAHLARLAHRDGILAKRLLTRAAPADDLSPLFLAAPPVDRMTIITAARRRALGRAGPNPNLAASPKAVAKLEQLALSGQRDNFVANLASCLAMQPHIVAPLVDDAFGEPLALALAAIRVPVTVAVRIFLFIDPRIGQSVERVRTLARLVGNVPAYLGVRLIAAMTHDASPLIGRAAYAAAFDTHAAQTPSRGGPRPVQQPGQQQPAAYGAIV